MSLPFSLKITRYLYLAVSPAPTSLDNLLMSFCFSQNREVVQPYLQDALWFGTFWPVFFFRHLIFP